MRKKTRKLLNTLLVQEDFKTAKDLAESLAMSRRSLMSSLDNLDDELAARGLAITERVTNKGIRLAPEEREDAARVLREDANNEILDFTDSSDRRFFLLFCFLCVQREITVELMAEAMATSARTVSNDIGALRECLVSQNISLEYDKRNGYEVAGNAFTVRNLLVQWMSASCETATTGDLARSVAGLYELMGSVPRGTLGASELSELFSTISDVVPNHYSRAANRVLLLHLLAAVLCNGRTDSFGFSDSDKAFLKKSVSFDIARILCLRASKLTGVAMNEDEDCYIATLLQSLPTNTEINDPQNYPFEVEVLVQQLIVDVSDGYAFDFSNDSELFGVIVGHVIPLIYRVLFNSQNDNPLLGEVAEKYARLNEVVRKSLAGLESYAGAPITDDECSFITLYFASSIEKMANSCTERARVIVVCNSGNAVSRLLQYKLVNAFNVEIVDTLAERDLYAALQVHTGIGLVVSVVELDPARLDGVPYLLVSPLLSDRDMNHLGRRLRARTFVKPDEQEAGPELLDLITSERFEVLDGVADMDALIREGGRLLHESGLCDAEYPDQMVSAAHCFGPMTTILIAPGIIMPHAGISEHVARTGFSFVRIREPIVVNGSSVTCALSLCTRNKKINQRGIQQFGLLLGRSSFMERVGEVNDFDSFAELVKKCLEEAERKYAP